MLCGNIPFETERQARAQFNEYQLLKRLELEKKFSEQLSEVLRLYCNSLSACRHVKISPQTVHQFESRWIYTIEFAPIQICEARITFPTGGVSAEAEDLVRGCLCLSPGARIRLEDVLSHPWLTRLVKHKAKDFQLSWAKCHQKFPVLRG